MSRETTPTKQWTDELDKRSSPNGATPKISAGWKRQLLLHAERSKKQAEKEVEKQKKIEEWRSEEKKKVVEAKGMIVFASNKTKFLMVSSSKSWQSNHYLTSTLTVQRAGEWAR